MIGMKEFKEYQYVEGNPMTDRDKTEVGSKFWNKGKWDNFVDPFLPDECGELSLIDVGCNAGIFLKEAKDRGFFWVMGIDSDHEAVARARNYRDLNGMAYVIVERYMEEYLNYVPAVDYTVLANTHYYFSIADWLKYVSALKSKTAYVIIVTAEKKPRLRQVSADPGDIKEYFKEWEQVGETITLPLDNDSHPRRLWGMCFKNPAIERVPIESLDNGNAQQRGFLGELDQGIDVFKTRYCKRLQSYRVRTTSGQQTWTKDELTKYMDERVSLYEDVKYNGVWEPLIIRAKDSRIIDGNHRHDILRHLGYKTLLIQKA